jgi:pSer/pThr/pTyr-binding forkhead associated (FHA) protein
MKIYFLNGEMSGVKVQLEKITSIGRDTSNTLSISGLGISRTHATFVFENDVWKIVDGGSTNGTRINHERVEGEQILKMGDIIELGNQTIRFGEVVDDHTHNTADASDAMQGIKPGKDTVHLDAQEIPKKDGNKIIFQPLEAGKKSGLKIKGSSSSKQKSLKATAKLPHHETVIDEAVDKKTVSKPKRPGQKRPTEAIASRELSDALKNGKISLFKPADDNKKATELSPEKNKQHKLSNLLFYVIVLAVAVVVVVIFLKFQEDKMAPAVTVKPVKKAPALFLLVYEKTKFSADNIFRFFIKIEDSKASFSIDDLKSQRSYEKTVTLTQNQLDNLKSQIEETEIMRGIAPPPGSATNELDESKRLLISYKGKINELKVVNNAVPVSFGKVTDAINDLVGEYGMQTIAMTPKELRTKAEELFNKAEALFHNRAGNPANLRKAVLRYNMAEEFLSQFSPKPLMWSKAKKRAAIAENIRKTRLKDLNKDNVKYKRLGEYEKRDEVLTEMMQLCLPESKLYRDIRKAKIDNDEKIRSLNKR